MRGGGGGMKGGVVMRKEGTRKSTVFTFVSSLNEKFSFCKIILSVSDLYLLTIVQI